MARTSYAVKFDPKLQEALKEFCEIKGFKQSAFVEKAVREQMEREELAEDLLDFYQLRATEPQAVPFEEYVKRRQR